jgi:hypothetical protein
VLLKLRFEPTPVISFEIDFVIVDENCSFHIVILTHEPEIRM